MPGLVYGIAEHDGGGAYRPADAWSQTFVTHDEARAAADMAAREVLISVEGTDILDEDARGLWHSDTISGYDRPERPVKG